MRRKTEILEEYKNNYEAKDKILIEVLTDIRDALNNIYNQMPPLS